MSCVAGVGGDVPPLVDTATSGRRVVAIDGCPLEHAKRRLERHGVAPGLHYVLSERGWPKSTTRTTTPNGLTKYATN